MLRILNSGRGWIRTIEARSNRFTVCPLWPLGNSPILNFKGNGAGGRTRTPDLLITNQLLYQLSYTSNFSLLCRLLPDDSIYYITSQTICQAFFSKNFKILNFVQNSQISTLFFVQISSFSTLPKPLTIPEKKSIIVIILHFRK